MLEGEDADATLHSMFASIRTVPGRLWAMSVLSAVLQILPFPIAGPVPMWRRAFCWFCLTPLLWALLSRDKTRRELNPVQAAWLSYLSGIAWYLGNCYWIYPTMHVYGSIASPAALGILVLFSLYVGLYHALFGWLFGHLHRAYGRQLALLFSPFVWVGVELARARITGFPWDLLGYTQVDNLTLTRLAPWTGVMGLSLVVAFANVLWLLRAPAGRKSPAYGAIAAVVIVAGAALMAKRGAPSYAEYSNEAVLVQDNLRVGAERVEPRESKAALLASLADLSSHPSYFAPMHKMVDGYWPVSAANRDAGLHTPSLVLWPEAPTDFLDNDPGFRGTLSKLAREEHAPVISDAIAVLPPAPGEENFRYFNAASFFSADGTYAGHYAKMHLVPFGEYTPYKQLFFFAGHLLDNVGGFTPGQERTLFRTGGHSYGTFICYESIFGDEVREFAKSGADLLMNVSDDGWYGDSSAPWEHLDMIRMRAIENHRWILRATNTGVTGSIDPYGRVVAQMPRHVRGSVLVPFGYRTDVTFYTQHGDWPGWMCAGITAGALLVGLARKREVH